MLIGKNGTDRTGQGAIVLPMGKLIDTLMGRDLTLTAADLPVLPAVGADVAGVASPAEWSNREQFAQITADQLFGEYLDLMPVTRDTALSVGAVDRAHQLITGQVASFPLIHMTDGRRTDDQPLLVRQPEAGRSRSQTIKWTTDDLLFHGRSYWQIVSRFAGTDLPQRFRYCAPATVETDTRGRVIRVAGQPVSNDDVLRIDGPHDGILNRPKRIREAIAIDVAAQNASANPVPSVDLHQTQGEPMTPEAVEVMKAGWIAARKKAGGGVGYSNPSIEVKTLGQHPEQLLIEGRNATSLNIARLMNVPAWAVDASVEGSSLTYSNVQGRSRELIDYTLVPYLSAIADRLSMTDVLPGRQSVRFDTSRLLTLDAKDLAVTLKTLVDGQIITAAQARLVLAGASLESIL